jgi:hypothetical protein
MMGRSEMIKTLDFFKQIQMNPTVLDVEHFNNNVSFR